MAWISGKNSSTSSYVSWNYSREICNFNFEELFILGIPIRYKILVRINLGRSQCNIPIKLPIKRSGTSQKMCSVCSNTKQDHNVYKNNALTVSFQHHEFNSRTPQIN